MGSCGHLINQIKYENQNTVNIFGENGRKENNNSFENNISIDSKENNESKNRSINENDKIISLYQHI